MYRDLTFWLGILIGCLFLASLGAFLLYVPVLSVMEVTTTLLGLIVMFCLGIQTGSRRIADASDDKDRAPGLPSEGR
jgi:hypothetical protein